MTKNIAFNNKAIENTKNETITEVVYILYSRNAFLAGYHSRDAELTSYRDALKEIVDNYKYCYFSNTTSTKRDFNDQFEDSINKAKQLIND